jgi:hypothetical protein
LLLYFDDSGGDLRVVGVLLFLMLYVFATFACASGAIWCFRSGKRWMGAENLIAFAAGLAALGWFAN